MRKLSFFTAVIFGLIAFQSCQSVQSTLLVEPIIGTANFNYWIHSPLHPDNSQAVTFKAKVADKEGIVKVELLVYEFELYENNKGQPSKRRRVDSQWGLVYDWEYDGLETSAEVAFTFARGFRPFTNVEYFFRVYNTKGEVSERLALFDAGDAKWPLDKITLYATSRTSLSNSINLCLLPDTDYNEDYRDFLTDMEKLVFDGFHQNNKIKEYKENWQFYYTQQAADGYHISKNFFEEEAFPDFIKNGTIQGMDAFGLMHKKPYSDGAYLKNNIHFLAYNIFTAESYNFGTAIHESAHAIFNLSDEYDLCACFEHPDGANMFSSLKGCQTFNEDNGFPVTDCTPLEHLNGQNWYMSEPSVLFATKEQCTTFNRKNGFADGICEKFKDHDGAIYYRALDGLCIMQDDGDEIVRDFQRTCSRVIDKYYERLNGYEEPALTAAIEDVDNIYGYQPVVLMELIHQKEQLAFEVKGVRQGIPKKNLLNRDAIQLDFLQSSGEKFSITLPNPEHLHIHKDGGGDEMVEVPKVNYTFTIPYKNDLETMICAQQMHLKEGLTAKNTGELPMQITKMDLVQHLRVATNVMSKK